MTARLFIVQLTLAVFIFSAPLLAKAKGAAASEVIKSQSDERDYRVLALDNQLKVLLITDPKTDKAAAAMDVAIGSGSDPDKRPGLAHFLEHMLFLGTQQFPKPGEYQDFISAHGGSHNAYTAFEHTNYFFDIDKNKLEPALDRFAQFFVAPLFTEKYVNRERLAVDSEYQSRRKEDGWREYDALKAILNPKHPGSRFSIGSKDSLTNEQGKGVRDELIRFYKAHYSANLMALVVLGKEPLDELEQWVRTRFSAIKNYGAVRNKITVPYFPKDRLPAKLNIVPIKDKRALSFSFPIPALKKHYLVKPVSYLSNLLGHEGKGSLLSLLKQKGWADGLSAGINRNDLDGANLDIDITLTREGINHVDEIGALLFQALRLIKDKGIASWRYEEQGKLSEIGFRYLSKDSAISTARRLAPRLHEYPTQDWLRGPYLMTNYDEGLIRDFLDDLRPDNVLMALVAPDLKTDQRARWFDTAYSVRPISPDTLKQWQAAKVNKGLVMPEPNLFVPRNLAIKPSEQATNVPTRIVKQPGMEVWFQQDTTFRLPRAGLYFSVRSPVANKNPRSSALTTLYTSLVLDKLNEFTYPASLAGLGFSVYPHMRGFSVRISGYNDRQKLLLERIVATLNDRQFDPKRFNIKKAEFQRSLRNQSKDPPFRRAIHEVSNLVLDPRWSEKQRLDALKPLTSSDLTKFAADLLRKVEIVVLANGNLNQQDALALGKIVEQGLLAHAEPIDVPHGNVVRLLSKGVQECEVIGQHPDTAIAIYHQGGDRSHALQARYLLLAHMISSPFYNDLRTEKQLGYVVFASPLSLLDVPSVVFVTQSPSTAPDKLKQHVKDFLAGYEDTLATMSDKEYQGFVDGLLTRILEKDENLPTRSDRYWKEIDRENYSFDSRQLLAKEVKMLSKIELQKFFSQFQDPSRTGKLIVRSTGSNHAKEKKPALCDPPTFKKDGTFISRAVGH